MSLADWSPAHRIKALEQQLRRFTMGKPESPTLAPQPDLFEQDIFNWIEERRNLRARVQELEARLEFQERELTSLRAEAETLVRVRNEDLAAHQAQLDAVNAERAYYHRFAIEVATSLNLVGQVCDEVMSKAQQEAYRRHDDGHGRAELPTLTIPKFLRAGPRRYPDEPEPEKPQGEGGGQ